MTIGIIFNGAGTTEAQYAQVLNQVSPGNQKPSGMISHSAGPREGGWCVIEVWESQEAAQQFFDQKLGAALQEAKITVQPTFFQVTNTM